MALQAIISEGPEQQARARSVALPANSILREQIHLHVSLPTFEACIAATLP